MSVSSCSVRRLFVKTHLIKTIRSVSFTIRVPTIFDPKGHLSSFNGGNYRQRNLLQFDIILLDFSVITISNTD